MSDAYNTILLVSFYPHDALETRGLEFHLALAANQIKSQTDTSPSLSLSLMSNHLAQLNSKQTTLNQTECGSLQLKLNSVLQSLTQL